MSCPPPLGDLPSANSVGHLAFGAAGEYDQGNPSYDDIGDGVTYGYGDEYDDKTDDIDSIITAGIDLMDEDEAIVADRNC